MKEETKIKIKKILFIISLLPYLAFLCLGVANTCMTTIEKGFLDLYCLVEPIMNFWDELLIDLNIGYITLAIFSVGYPIYYLLDKPKKEKKEVQKTDTKKLDKAFIIFMISFIPYLFIVFTCIFGIDFGFFSNVTRYYGFSAIFLAVLIGTIIPVYPILLIFQIIFIIKRYKVFSDIQKKIFKITITLLTLLIIVPSIFYLIKDKKDLNDTYSNDKVIIEKYLKNKYGEENYENMVIEKQDEVSSEYRIKSSLIDGYFILQLNEPRTEVVSDSFQSRYIEKNKLKDKLNNYLSTYYNLPIDVTIGTNIKSFDVKKLSNIEALLKSCEYSINSLYIKKNVYDKNEIVDIIRDYFMNYDEFFKEYYSSNYLMIYVEINDKNYASIQAIKSSIDNRVIRLIFKGYTDENGTTIPSEELTININQNKNIN